MSEGGLSLRRAWHVFAGRPAGAPASPSVSGSDVRIDRAADIQHAQIDAEGLNVISGPSKVSGLLSLGRGSTIAPGCHLVGGTIRIGRYCQLGPNVGVYAINHPVTHLTSYVNRRLFDGRLKAAIVDQPVSIGHDVWFGHGAVVLPGVAIGSGAIVGAGAIVTRDVEPYAIVGGNPARVIRMRFTAELRAVLAELCWWNLGPDNLARLEPAFHLDLDAEPARGIGMIRGFLDRR